MGVKELREAFNAVAGNAFTCTSALMIYDRVDNSEWQILIFSGTADTGSPFEARSEPLGPGVDVNQAAKEVAQRLLDQRTGPP